MIWALVVIVARKFVEVDDAAWTKLRVIARTMGVSHVLLHSCVLKVFTGSVPIDNKEDGIMTDIRRELVNDFLRIPSMIRHIITELRVKGRI